jgi:hypothetical protein
MDNERIVEVVGEVLDELGMGDRDYEVETAMSSPNPEAFQVRLLDSDGDGPAVVIDLSEPGGGLAADDEIRRRIRQQLSTFAAAG